MSLSGIPLLDEVMAVVDAIYLPWAYVILL